MKKIAFLILTILIIFIYGCQDISHGAGLGAFSLFCGHNFESYQKGTVKVVMLKKNGKFEFDQIRFGEFDGNIDVRVDIPDVKIELKNGELLPIKTISEDFVKTCQLSDSSWTQEDNGGYYIKICGSTTVFLYFAYEKLVYAIFADYNINSIYYNGKNYRIVNFTYDDFVEIFGEPDEVVKKHAFF